MDHGKATWNTRRRGSNKKTTKKSLEVSEKYSDSLIALNESSFKIRRFMNDVSTFREKNNVKAKKTKFPLESLEKENIDPKSNIDFQAKKPKKRSEFKEKDDAPKASFVGKKGLFEKGISTKMYARGLMPPMWNARLNADLQSILDLACGKSKKKHIPSASIGDASVDEGPKSMHSRSPSCASNESPLVYGGGKTPISSNELMKPLEVAPSLDERRSIVLASCSRVGSAEKEPTTGASSIGIINRPLGSARDDESAVAPSKSDKARDIALSDLYLQYSHFIVKSLSTSRIDRQQMESCSKVAAKTLADFYRERLLNESQEYEECGDEEEEYGTNEKEEEEKEEEERDEETPSSIFSPQHGLSIAGDNKSLPFFTQKPGTYAHTSRSDEWPTANTSGIQDETDRQSDDIVIRHSKIYSSGLKLLESVYGNDQQNIENGSPTKYIFSPVVDDTGQVKKHNFCPNPSGGKNPSSDWNHGFKTNQESMFNVHRYYNYQPMCCNDGQMNCDVLRNNDQNCDNPCESLRYWPGLSGIRPGSIKQMENRSYPQPFSSSHQNNTGMNERSTINCLSILPPNFQRFRSWRYQSQNLYGIQPRMGMESEQCEKDKSFAIPDSLLTLPLRPPARESPDIQYYPRRMF